MGAHEREALDWIGVGFMKNELKTWYRRAFTDPLWIAFVVSLWANVLLIVLGVRGAVPNFVCGDASGICFLLMALRGRDPDHPAMSKTQRVVWAAMGLVVVVASTIPLIFELV